MTTDPARTVTREALAQELLREHQIAKFGDYTLKWEDIDDTFRDLWRAHADRILANLPPADSATLAAERAVVADWLVRIGYPFDFHWPTNPPPISMDGLVDAWMRADPGDSRERWEWAIEQEVSPIELDALRKTRQS